MKNDPLKSMMEGTRAESKDGTIKRQNLMVSEPIKSVSASEVKLPSNVFLTFGLYTPKVMPTNLAYVRQLFTPRNGEKNIVPISYSFDLVKLLTRQEHPICGEVKIKEGGASTNITRGTELSIIKGLKDKVYSLDVGMLDLYNDLPNQNKNIADIIQRDASRDLFQIAVPENNPGVIAFKTGDVSYEEMAKFSFSKRYQTPKVNEDVGFQHKTMKKGALEYLTQEDLSEADDKVVICFGSYFGPKKNDRNEINPKRNLLMYFTPKEIIPKL